MRGPLGGHTRTAFATTHGERLDRHRLVLATPMGLTLLAAIWTAAVTPYSKYGDDWAILPFIGILLVVIAWHVALTIRGPERRFLFCTVSSTWRSGFHSGCSA
jgi:hypothetical protein